MSDLATLPPAEAATVVAAPFDREASDRVAERMIATLNAGAFAAMTSLGYRSGLFDVMARLPPSTSAEIAAAAGLVERYVREWLAVMVTGRVVAYDPARRTYRLPPEHAALLTRAASPNNLAVAAQSVAMCAAMMEDRILGCFREGGGLPYGDYHRFHEVMAEDSGQTVVAALFDAILPLIPGLTARLESGIDVLDAGCGVGRALIEMAARIPPESLRRLRPLPGRDRAGVPCGGRARPIERPLRGARPDRLRPARALRPGDRVRRGPRPEGPGRAAAGHRARPQARWAFPDAGLLMQDVGGPSYLENNLDHPFAPLLYAISCLCCTPVSLAQGGAGLGTMWGEEPAERMLREAGFGRVERHRLPHDPISVDFVGSPT